ncbi:MAG: LysR family transcriptional regulator [Oscillospiraceae bacterium]|nr:LysR family transcriptional regulator [Oscillospiraceae bacterium]
MDYNKLYYFYVTAKLCHVTNAAKVLCIAQPSLTKAIKLLEDELSAPLFYKHKRNIYLTPFGEFLKNRLDDVFPVLDNIGREFDDMKSKSKNTINVNVLAASAMVTQAIVEYKKSNPAAIFQVVQNEAESYCDISVSTDDVDFSRLPSFDKKEVISENIYLAVSRKSEFAQLESVDLKAVANEGFISLAGSRLFRRVCDRMCRIAQIEPQIIFESDSPIAVMNLIRSNVGIGFWPAFSWGEKPKDIAFLPVINTVCKRQLIIGFHDRSHISDISADFYGFLVEFIKRRSDENV